MICENLSSCLDENLAGRLPAKCGNDSKQCIMSSDARPEVNCEQKKKKYILENTQKNHVISYQMDGGIIVVDRTVPEGTNKCDNLFIINADELTAILIELKGKNVPHALDQIQGSLDLYKGLWKKFSHVYGRAVVTSSTPDLKASPKYVNLSELLKKKYHGNIKIEERQFKEKDIQLSDKGR